MSFSSAHVEAESKEQSQPTKFPTINYIWVGPPSVTAEDVKGQDISGPQNMAKANKDNPIVF